MFEQIKNLAAEVPNGVYSLLAALLPLLGAFFLQSKKIKGLQEIAEKNISMLKEVPVESSAHEIFEEIVIQNAQKIKEESAKQKDWTAIFIAGGLLAVAYFVGVFAVYLGSLGGVSIVGAIVAWVVVVFVGLVGLVGLAQGLSGKGRKEGVKR